MTINKNYILKKNKLLLSMLEIINLSERKSNLLEITNKKNFLLIELREIINTMVKEKVIFLKKK